jgi:hypothetical protein
VIDVVYTRDRVMPLEGAGWRCVPRPPNDSAEWRIFDTSKDHKTGWVRRIVFCSLALIPREARA